MNKKKKIIQPTEYATLQREFILVNAISGGAILFMLFVIVLQKLGVAPSLPCGIHMVFHVYCPGCGGTRALTALLQGKILDSLGYNPMIILGIFLILYYELGVVITLLKKSGKKYLYFRLWPVYAYLILGIIFAVVRDYLLLAEGIDVLGDFIP